MGDYERLFSHAIDGSGSPILLSRASPLGDASFPIAAPEPSARLLAFAALAGMRRGHARAPAWDNGSHTR